MKNEGEKSYKELDALVSVYGQLIESSKNTKENLEKNIRDLAERVEFFKNAYTAEQQTSSKLKNELTAEKAKAQSIIPEEYVIQRVTDLLIMNAVPYFSYLSDPVQEKIQKALQSNLEVLSVHKKVNLVAILEILARAESVSILFTKDDVKDLIANDIDPITEKNVDKILYLLDTEYFSAEGVESFFPALGKALNKFSLTESGTPFEQLSQKIDLLMKVSKNTATLERMYYREKENEKYTDLIQSMHVPQTDEMLVNLVWLKKEKDIDPEGLIFPREYKRLKVEKQDAKTINIFKRLDAWASEFPVVYLWYDGTLLSDGSVERTQAEIQKNCVNYQKIQLMDVRTLKTVQDNDAIFNHPDFVKLSPYVKSNLLRVAISYEQATAQPVGQPPYVYSLYADMSISPFLPELISQNPKAIYDLNTCGFVMSSSIESLRYENNFHIFSNMNSYALEALKIVEIDFNLRCINDFLTKTPPYNNAVKIHDEIAWGNFSNVGSVFLSLSSKATWTLNGIEFKDAIQDPSFTPYAWFDSLMVEDHDRKALVDYLGGEKTYPTFNVTESEWKTRYPNWYSSFVPTLDAFSPMTSNHRPPRKKWTEAA